MTYIPKVHAYDAAPDGEHRPILSLHDDILILIFCLTEEYSVVPFSSRMRVACVVSKWRQLAKSTPLLWAQMDISLPTGPHDADAGLSGSAFKKLDLRSIDTFRIHRERAQTIPLRVALILHTPKESNPLISDSTNAMISEILSTSTQWASFCLISEGTWIPSLILDVLTKSELPSLARLSLHSPDPTSATPIDLSIQVNIRHIDSNMAIASGGLSNLRTLTLYSVSPNGLLHSIDQLVHLDTLCIASLQYESYGGGWARSVEGDLVVPSLKHLVWGRFNADTWLRKIVLPNLETFELRHLQHIDDVYPSWYRSGSGWGVPTWEYPERSSLLTYLVESGRLGSPSSLIIRDFHRLGDIQMLMQAFNNSITMISLLDDEEYNPVRSASLTSIPASCILPNLRHLCVPVFDNRSSLANESAFASVVSLWESREAAAISVARPRAPTVHIPFLTMGSTSMWNAGDNDEGTALDLVMDSAMALGMRM